jgi:hypothetical protein
LFDGDAEAGVLGDALGVADEHVDDAVDVANGVDVFIEWQWS